MPTLRLPDREVTGRALIFDKDGVLVDFHRFWGEVSRRRVEEVALRTGLDAADRQRLIRELGIVAGRVDPSGPLSVGTRVEAQAIASAFLYRRGRSWLEAAPLVEEAFDAAEASLDWDVAVQPLGDVAGALTALREQGWKLAIATSDRTRNAERHAERLGIATLMGAIAGSDSVSRSKPHADLVLACCEALGVAPGESIVIGDTLADLMMARAAGSAAAIGVTCGVSDAQTLSAQADAVLEGVWQIPAISRPSKPSDGPAIDPSRCYVLATDGASRGNPGPAGIGLVLSTEEGAVIRELALPLGVTTNNVAEYRALIRGLQEAERLGIRRLIVRSDSELVIRQLEGRYAVRHDALIPLYHEAQNLIGNFRELRLEHVDRARNARADALANEGAKQNQSGS